MTDNVFVFIVCWLRQQEGIFVPESRHITLLFFNLDELLIIQLSIRPLVFRVPRTAVLSLLPRNPTPLSSPPRPSLT